MKLLYTISLFSLLIIGCKAGKEEQVATVFSNDEHSAKMIGFLKAIEAEDTATVSSLLSEDLKHYDENNSPWVDNIYFKDTLPPVGKANYMASLVNSFGSYDSIRFDNPSITTTAYKSGDSVTTVKSFKSLIVKKTEHKHSMPHFKTYRWSKGKIIEIIAYDKRWVSTPDGYGFDGYVDSTYGYDEYGGGVLFDTLKDSTGKK